MTIKKDLKQMAELQDNLNSYILGKDWVNNKKADWIRAAWIECAEIMDFLCFKWWKKQTPNIAQAQIELVDIWHFLLSDFIKSGGDIEVLVTALEGANEVYHDWKAWDWNGQEYSHLNGVESLVFSLMTDGHDSCYYTDFFALCLSLDLSFSSLMTQYIAKNVLNIFRQDNGYKTGDYIKEWPSPLEPNVTLEDNVFLEMFMADAKKDSIAPGELFDYVYQRLVDNYPGEKK